MVQVLVVELEINNLFECLCDHREIDDHARARVNL